MEIYKDIKTPASKEFEKLLNSQLSKTKNLVEGKIIEGKITKITDKFAFLFIEGLKSEPMLDINELKSMGMSDKAKVGEKISVLLERIEDRNGEVLVSASKAQKIKGWDKLVEAYEKNESINGKITSKCKGGVIVEHIDTGSLMFCPGSQISDKPLKDISHLMNEPLKFALIKLDKVRGNACVSRRQIITSNKKGDKAKIRVPASVQCKDCKGIGSKNGVAPETCNACNGHGKVRAQQGFFTIERTCPTCQGSGQVIKESCSVCKGSGRIQKQKTLSVNIPSGVEDGTRIRLSGEGEAGLNGSPPGDLYIFISISPHYIFQRDNANIYCRVPIPFTSASLGGHVEVPTVDGGRAKITIPAGTQSGFQFRLKSKGMSILRSKERGDMFVEALVETPVNLSKRQKEILKEFEDEGKNEKNNPETEGFFSKVRDLWEDLKD